MPKKLVMEQICQRRLLRHLTIPQKQVSIVTLVSRVENDKSSLRIADEEIESIRTPPVELLDHVVSYVHDTW